MIKGVRSVMPYYADQSKIGLISDELMGKFCKLLDYEKAKLSNNYLELKFQN